MLKYTILPNLCPHSKLIIFDILLFYTIARSWYLLEVQIGNNCTRQQWYSYVVWLLVRWIPRPKIIITQSHYQINNPHFLQLDTIKWLKCKFTYVWSRKIVFKYSTLCGTSLVSSLGCISEIKPPPAHQNYFARKLYPQDWNQLLQSIEGLNSIRLLTVVILTEIRIVTSLYVRLNSLPGGWLFNSSRLLWGVRSLALFYWL